MPRDRLPATRLPCAGQRRAAWGTALPPLRRAAASNATYKNTQPLPRASTPAGKRGCLPSYATRPTTPDCNRSSLRSPHGCQVRHSQYPSHARCVWYRPRNVFFDHSFAVPAHAGPIFNLNAERGAL